MGDLQAATLGYLLSVRAVAESSMRTREVRENARMYNRCREEVRRVDKELRRRQARNRR